MTLPPRPRWLAEPLADGGRRLHTRNCMHRARASRTDSLAWLSGMRRHLADTPQGPAYRVCPLCRPLGPLTDAYEAELDRLARETYGPRDALNMRRWLSALADTAITCMEITMFDEDTAR